jgi:phosphatidylserine/phosphatidylglycerophosphate/cardiolipin synthase-like enzyme
MRTEKIQFLLIALGTLGFWGYQFSHAETRLFPAKTPYRVCFSPKGNCENTILHLINNAKKSLYIQSYSFTSKKIAQALIRAKRNGVEIKMIVDRSLFDPEDNHSYIKPILAAGIPVWVDNEVSIQHNKVIIVDQEILETGSYNYTVSANRYNAENVLIIKSPDLALLYLNNWRKRQLISTPSARYQYKKRQRF